MALYLRIENETSLPDGGPIDIRVTGRRGIDIGRDGHLDWSLPDPTRYISSKHCEVRYEKGDYVLYDVSTNGTFINGSERRMPGPHRLKNGDRIIIGNYIVAVEVDVSDLGEAPKQRSVARSSDPWDVASSVPPVDRKDVIVPVDRRPNNDPLNWAIDLPDLVPVERKTRSRDPFFDSVPEQNTAPAPRSAPQPYYAESTPKNAFDVWNDPGQVDFPAAPVTPPRPPAFPPPQKPSQTSNLTQPVPAQPIPSQPFPSQPAASPPTPVSAVARPPAFAPPPLPSSIPTDDAIDARETRAIPMVRKAAVPAATPAEVELSPRGDAERGSELAARAVETLKPASARAAETPVSTGATASALMERFARGAGIPPESLSKRDPGDIMEDLGGMMRLVVDNMMELNAARRETKRVMRSSDHTVISAHDNNPLKFMPSAEHALMSMIDRPTRSYLSGPQALQESFEDLQNHQKRVFVAMQQAMKMLFEDIDPAAIDKNVEGDRGMAALIGSRKVRLWDHFVARWQAKTLHSEDGIVGLFMIYFADCYDRLGDTENR